MKANGNFDSIPESGVMVKDGGNSKMVWFGFEKTEPKVSTEGMDEETSDNAYTFHDVRIKGEVTYSSVISAIVNEKYSLDDVQAIIANYEDYKAAEEPTDKQKEYLQEYLDYQDWRKYAKEVAKVAVES